MSGDRSPYDAQKMKEQDLDFYRKLNDSIENAIEDARKHDPFCALNTSVLESRDAFNILFVGLNDSRKRFRLLNVIGIKRAELAAHISREIAFARGATASMRRMIDWIDEAYNRIEKDATEQAAKGEHP